MQCYWIRLKKNKSRYVICNDANRETSHTIVGLFVARCSCSVSFTQIIWYNNNVFDLQPPVTIINQNAWIRKKKKKKTYAKYSTRVVVSREMLDFIFISYFVCILSHIYFHTIQKWILSISLFLLLGRFLSWGSARHHVCCMCLDATYILSLSNSIALLSCGMVPMNLQPKSSDKKTPYGNNRKRNANIKSIM